jgi:hypothetical protein
MPRANRKEIDLDIASVEAVLREWDPIGVFPNWESSPAADEYDSYAPQLLSMLYGNHSLSDIADRLELLRTKTMGLPRNRHRDEAVATQLLQLSLRKRPLVRDW